MKVYFATDHAGFELKEKLVAFVREELGNEVEDLGAHEYNLDDDYPDYIHLAAREISEDPTSRAIILGASGQGEAIMANRYEHVRAVVFYGEPNDLQIDAQGEQMDIVTSTRKHNDANVLSIGARFVDEESAKKAVRVWLATNFSEKERHIRRINKIDALHT